MQQLNLKSTPIFTISWFSLAQRVHIFHVEVPSGLIHIKLILLCERFMVNLQHWVCGLLRGGGYSNCFLTECAARGSETPTRI